MQVSQSALKFYRLGIDDQDTTATAQFVLLMDHIFDCFNVRGMQEGKKTSKAEWDPNWSGKDCRFAVSH